MNLLESRLTLSQLPRTSSFTHNKLPSCSPSLRNLCEVCLLVQAQLLSCTHHPHTEVETCSTVSGILHSPGTGAEAVLPALSWGNVHPLFLHHQASCHLSLSILALHYLLSGPYLTVGESAPVEKGHSWQQCQLLFPCLRLCQWQNAGQLESKHFGVKIEKQLGVFQ